MKRILYLTQASIIAALYVVLTYISAAVGLSSYAIQCRLGEALCILPIFTPAAIPGVTIGCFLANLLTTASIFDITLGTLATFVGALGAYYLRHGKLRILASLPTVLANAVTVPLILHLMAVPDILYLYTAFTVAVGEIISCTILGGILSGVIIKTGLDKELLINDKKRNFR